MLTTIHNFKNFTETSNHYKIGTTFFQKWTVLNFKEGMKILFCESYHKVTLFHVKTSTPLEFVFLQSSRHLSLMLSMIWDLRTSLKNGSWVYIYRLCLSESPSPERLL